MPACARRLAVLGATPILVLSLWPAVSATASNPVAPGPEVAPGVFLGGARTDTTTIPGKAEAPVGDRQTEPRIEGGTATTIEQWPWQVAIAANPARYSGDGFARQFCGGSLVAPNIVITAAHCTYDVFDNDNNFDDPANFSAITGRTRLSSNAGQEIPVSEIHFFTNGAGKPLYNPNTSEWDVVFLKLASHSVSGTIKIAGADERASWAAGKSAHATGWGNTMFGTPTYQDDLHEVQVPIVADSTCGSLADYGSDFHPQTMVCAGEAGKDTCQGDSGGPLVVPGPTGAYRLVGDTSWGAGCGLPGKPGVYGRLADDPMRSALQNGILRVTCTDVVGAGPAPSLPPRCTPDTDPPQTKITKHPRKRIRSDKRRVRVRFMFNSDEPGSSFECKRDRRPFKHCTSPKTYRIGTPEDPRTHVFKVRATDPAGNTDPTAARFRFKVSS
jgi:trypsin